MSLAFDELSHMIKHLGHQGQIEQRSTTYGHIADYNVDGHIARVIVPSMRDEVTGAPVYSGWLPMGVLAGGDQSGFQFVPFGGATPDNPTQGELCQVQLNERGNGVAAITGIMYTAAQQPPHTALPNSGMQPGDMVYRNKSGTYIWFHASSGNVELVGGGDGSITVTSNGSGNVTVNSAGSGKTTVTSANETDVVAPIIKLCKAVGDTLMGFCKDNFRVLYNGHQHAVGGPVPIQQADTTHVTQIVTGE